MTNTLLQPSFTAGEVSPSLYGRVDTVRYAVGLKRCRDFIVRPYGGVESRAGFYHLAETFNDTDFRLLPFVFAADPGEDVAYVIELGHLYARFLANDALVQVQTSDTTAYAGGTTYGLHAFVNSAGILYRSIQAGNTGNTPASSPLWWVADATLVVATPWTSTQLTLVRYTQSADVLYMANQAVAPQTIQRVSSSFFRVVPYVSLEGPFTDLNVNEAAVVVASATVGNVTLTSNTDIFTANAIGSSFYMETKNLGQLKPWVVGERGLTVGVLRRSDGKTYRLASFPSGGTSWHETGNRQPVHDYGRAWDGSGDVRTNGTETWTVGVEWEYVDSGYGIVEITGVTSPTVATGTVKKQLPAQVVGSLPVAASTWNFVGDGVTKVFSLTGPDVTDGTYAVTIAGVPVQPDPNYVPPPPTGGGGFNSGGNGNIQNEIP